MELQAGKKQGEYTMEDYYALPDERRVELLDGVIYDMASAEHDPSVYHPTADDCVSDLYQEGKRADALSFRLRWTFRSTAATVPSSSRM